MTPQLLKARAGTRWWSGAMLFSLGILVLAGAGLRPAMLQVAERFKKTGLSLRKPLQQFDVTQLRNFRISGSPLQIAGTEKEIGTKDFAFIGLEELAAVTSKEASLLLSYYNDPHDKVPHTPEVCYRHTGHRVESTSETALDVPGYPGLTAKVVVLSNDRESTVVVYTFHANGRFYQSRNQVRWLLMCPGERHVYFCKIEAAAFCRAGADSQEVVNRCRRLLSEAIPVLISDHFPIAPPWHTGE